MTLDENQSGAAAPRPKLPYVVAVLAGLLVIGLAVWLVVGRRQAGPAADNAIAAAPAPVAGAPAAAPPPAATPGRGRLLPSGLRIETLSEGSGPLITRADAVLVRYELRGPRGDMIDSNMEAPQGMGMTLNLVVPGFAEGLTHMRQGGVARLWVPPHLAYGASVPPGAPFGPTDTLMFLIRVEQVAPGEAAAMEAAQRGPPPPS
ncbi:MAG TPA: FKBP-type peptidyl-prolyl cis-trans isomerase [Allosphingosinicella sp.]|nr:FKBP-type peptidyl-prolyl cis-trans isomerase [Allosphingosinicella sp.]